MEMTPTGMAPAPILCGQPLTPNADEARRLSRQRTSDETRRTRLASQLESADPDVISSALLAEGADELGPAVERLWRRINGDGPELILGPATHDLVCAEWSWKGSRLIIGQETSRQPAWIARHVAYRRSQGHTGAEIRGRDDVWVRSDGQTFRRETPYARGPEDGLLPSEESLLAHDTRLPAVQVSGPRVVAVPAGAQPRTVERRGRVGTRSTAALAGTTVLTADGTPSPAKPHGSYGFAFGDVLARAIMSRPRSGGG